MPVGNPGKRRAHGQIQQAKPFAPLMQYLFFGLEFRRGGVAVSSVGGIGSLPDKKVGHPFIQ